MRTLRFFFCLSVSVCLFLSASSPAWAEDTGHLRLQIQAPPDFNTSIMINLIQEDVNTLLVAEPINHYKITQDVPAGTYQVDFVAADPYTVTYSKAVTVRARQTAELPIQINAPTPHQAAAATSISEEGAAEAPAEVPKMDSGTSAHPGHASSKAKEKNGQELAWALVRQCGASCFILLAVGIGYILMKKRKEE